MVLLTFILISYGACNNMIYGSIFEGWRNYLKKFGEGGYSLHKLFTCFMCLGTWMGFALSLIMCSSGFSHLTPMGSLGMNDVLLSVFLNGLLSGGAVWLIHTLQEMMERAFQN